jgi:hypothetical protein
MWGTICIAHAAIAVKAGRELLAKSPAPELIESHSLAGTFRAIFMAPDLLKQGPRVNLTWEEISIFADDPRYETWICTMGLTEGPCPVVRSLHDRFKMSCCLVLFDAANAATPADKLRLLLTADLDRLFSFQG